MEVESLHNPIRVGKSGGSQTLWLDGVDISGHSGYIFCVSFVRLANVELTTRKCKALSRPTAWVS